MIDIDTLDDPSNVAFVAQQTTTVKKNMVAQGLVERGIPITQEVTSQFRDIFYDIAGPIKDTQQFARVPSKSGNSIYLHVQMTDVPEPLSIERLKRLVIAYVPEYDYEDMEACTVYHKSFEKQCSSRETRRFMRHDAQRRARPRVNRRFQRKSVLT